ncbi:MAG: hypothetical protein KDJ55_15070 [Rhodobiaceae bacterium]|nr:hypothetical protein [Rhodobiaceae bacterium]MCC0013781.1 hypothetical protein [Rhodobiaceae bacterium]MCC0018617.1 hypothetical protein [Rhodobiaceae bacterium]MCC0062211.1 hypothetical protein [Rhodobiaceae bacterium]
MFKLILGILGGLEIIAGAAMNLFPSLPPEISYALIAIGILTIIGAIFVWMREDRVPKNTSDSAISVHNEGIFTTNQSGGTNILRREPDLPTQRTLTELQKTKISAKIAKSIPGAVLVIPQNSRESRTFESQITNILGDHGWSVDHLFVGYTRDVFDGVVVGWKKDKSKAFHTLVSALKDAGITVNIHEFESNCEQDISLQVGVLEMPEYQRSVDEIRG